MDTQTALAIFGAKDVITKLLCPTADYLGKELESFTKLRIKNVKRIFKTAEKRFENILIHSIYGLSSLGLIASNFCFGSSEYLKQTHPQSDFLNEPGIIIQPTPLGVEVFLCALGCTDLAVNKLLDPTFTLPKIKGITINTGAKKIMQSESKH